MHPTLSIFLLLPLVAHAQHTPTTFQDDDLFGPKYVASIADSVDFAAFRSALHLTEPGQDGDPTSVIYRLVWRRYLMAATRRRSGAGAHLHDG